MPSHGPSVVQLRTQDLLSEGAARIVARAGSLQSQFPHKVLQVHILVLDLEKRVVLTKR